MDLIRRVLANIAMLHVLAAVPISAQSRGALVPSIDMATLYDDNVFVTSRAPASDRVIRITPAVSAERTYPRGGYWGSYSVDAEGYARHSALTNPASRVQAFSRMRYNAGQRLHLLIDHGYVRTSAPTELNLGTGLASGRIRTTRMSGGSSAVYRLSKRATASASYQATRDRLEDGRAMRADVARAGVDRTLSRRERLELDYENSRFDSHSQSTTGHAVRLGWTRGIGAQTQLQLRGGPRVTAGSASADLFARVNHAREHGSIAVSFEQAQTTVIGLEVPVGVQSIQIYGRWSPTRSLSCTAAPGIFRSRFGGRNIHVLRMAFDARYTLTKTMALEASYGAETQRGMAEAAFAGVDVLRHRTLSVGVTRQWK